MTFRAYSPELDPVEEYLRQLQVALSNCFFDSLDDLTSAIDIALDQLSISKASITSSTYYRDAPSDTGLVEADVTYRACIRHPNNCYSGHRYRGEVTIVPNYDAPTDQLTRQRERLDTAYVQTMTDRHQRLDQAYEQHVRSELTDLATTLDRAYKTHEQQKRHEHEQAVAAQARRRQWSALTALVLLVCVLVGYITL